MKKRHEYDFIILGGGCASLSFAVELTKNQVNKYKFLILEDRKKYEDDKSWCFWHSKENPFSTLVSKSWDSFSFSCDGKEIIHRSKEYCYQYIRSLDFYKYALKKIKKNPSIILKLGEKVLRTKKFDEKYIVKTNKQKYITRSILDTRTKKDICLEEPFLFQSFLGYEILLNSNKYNTDKAHIMQDMRVSNDRFLFDYILPIKNNTVLIELTSFSKQKLRKEELKKILEKDLVRKRIFNYKILRTEFGIIPMGFLKKNKIEPNYFYAGALGGAVRASSGYAFLRIQKWAKDCAVCLKETGQLISHPKENLITFKLDKIFLNVLEKNIISANQIFYFFFKKINTNSLIRFMSGNPKMLDYLKIIIAMPKKFFLHMSVLKKYYDNKK